MGKRLGVVMATLLAAITIVIGGDAAPVRAAPSPAVALSGGGNHTCGIHADGTLSCWGANANGEAVPPSGTFEQVAGGSDITCGVRTGGAATCWGGAPGQGRIEPPTGTFREVGVGSWHGCGIKSDRSLACWGDNREGLTEHPAGSDFETIRVGMHHSCAIRTDATMSCWGNEFDGSLDVPTGRFSDVSIGFHQSCAIRTDGRVACWGHQSGAFDIGDVPNGRFTDIAFGGGFACALRTDATISCWGSPDAGGLDAPPGRFVEVAAGSNHACAIGTDGAVSCWGSGVAFASQPPQAGYPLPVMNRGAEGGCFEKPDGEQNCHPLNAPDWLDPAELVEYDPGSWVSCAVFVDGSLECWGSKLYGGLDLPDGDFVDVEVGGNGGCARTRTGIIRCWGEGTPTPPAGTFVSMSLSYNALCGLEAAGTIRCSNRDTEFPEEVLPSPPPGSFIDVVVGSQWACGTRLDATIECWTSVAAGPSLVPSGEFRSLSNADDRFCAISEVDDSIVCFGPYVDDRHPAPVGGFDSVDVGAASSCAVRMDGVVQCWGDSTLLGEPFSEPRFPQTPSLTAGRAIRILDTRVGASTFDGVWAGTGPRDAGSDINLWLRNSVLNRPTAVVLSVTVVSPQTAGFLTLWPCQLSRPTASSLNFVAGQTVSNTVIVRTTLDRDGVCVYTSAPTEIIADIIGTVPAGGSLATHVPARLADTRSSASTVDGIGAGTGRLEPREILEIPTWGRGGVRDGASAVVLNVVSVLPDAPGYLTVFPCGGDVPVASNVNALDGITANMVFSAVDDTGRVCVFSSAATDVVVDVTGHVPAGVPPFAVAPARLADTRPGGSTIDAIGAGAGRIEAEATFVVDVTGRAGIPDDAATAMLNVTAVSPSGHGYLTVYPCGQPRPFASAMTYAPGDLRAVAVPARVGRNGTVCVFTKASTDLVIDVSGYVGSG